MTTDRTPLDVAKGGFFLAIDALIKVGYTDEDIRESLSEYLEDLNADRTDVTVYVELSIPTRYVNQVDYSTLIEDELAGPYYGYSDNGEEVEVEVTSVWS